MKSLFFNVKNLCKNTSIIKLLVFLLVFFRLLFLISVYENTSIILSKDSITYLRLSEDIRYYYFNDNLEDFWFSTFRPIGFPLLLNLFTSIFEFKYFIFLNLTFDFLTCWFLHKIITKTININYANIGIIFYLLNLNILISSTQILTESISVMLFTGSIYYLLSKNLIFSGVYLSLFSVIKPYGLYFFVSFLFVYIIVYKMPLKKIILFTSFPIITFIPILINNYVQFEKVFISTSSSFHLLYLNNASEQLCKDINFEHEIVSNPTWNKNNFNNSLTNEELINSRKYITALENRASMNLFSNLRCKALSVTRSIYYQMFGIRSSSWNNIFVGSGFILIAIFSAIGVLISNISLISNLFIKKNKNLNIIYFLTILHILISAVIPYGNSRFRVLVEPLLIVLILYFLHYLNNKNSTI